MHQQTQKRKPKQEASSFYLLHSSLRKPRSPEKGREKCKPMSQLFCLVITNFCFVKFKEMSIKPKRASGAHVTKTHWTLKLLFDTDWISLEMLLLNHYWHVNSNRETHANPEQESRKLLTTRLNMKYQYHQQHPKTRICLGWWSHVSCW